MASTTELAEIVLQLQKLEGLNNRPDNMLYISSKPHVTCLHCGMNFTALIGALIKELEKLQNEQKM